MPWEYSVLVVANVTAGSDELLDALKARAERDPTRFTLLVPATGGGRGGREGAERRLGQALERMGRAGLKAEGRVGDSDPVAAVKDVWDPKEFDEIFVSTLATGASKWLQVDTPRRIERMTGVPGPTWWPRGGASSPRAVGRLSTTTGACWRRFSRSLGAASQSASPSAEFSRRGGRTRPPMPSALVPTP